METYNDCFNSENILEAIGKQVIKRSGKPFKDKEHSNIVVGITKNIHSGKPAFILNGSIVDIYQCVLFGTRPINFNKPGLLVINNRTQEIVLTNGEQNKTQFWGTLLHSNQHQYNGLHMSELCKKDYTLLDPTVKIILNNEA